MPIMDAEELAHAVLALATNHAPDDCVGAAARLIREHAQERAAEEKTRLRKEYVRRKIRIHPKVGREIEHLLDWFEKETD
jgi:hypothetical protein